MGTPDRECSIETVADYLLDSRSLEDLQLLLTEEEAWKQFVAGVDLYREEEDALREALDGIFADPDGENEEKLQNDPQDKERKEEDALSEALGAIAADADAEDEEELQYDLWHEERFLDGYLQVILELEKRIRKLHTLADKVHKDCAISQVVASSSSCVWSPDNPWFGSGTCDSSGQSGTFSHWLGTWSSSGCD